MLNLTFDIEVIFRLEKIENRIIYLTPEIEVKSNHGSRRTPKTSENKNGSTESKDTSDV